MTKLVLSSLLAMLLLSSCNLPAGEPSATPDLVATQVAMLLTSQPSPQPLNPTETAGPSQTPEIAASVTPTETTQPTPTPTTSPTDPREALGNPDFTDMLDSGKSFGLENQSYDDDYTLIRVQNGALMLTSKYAIGYRGWRTGGTKLKDAYIEARMQVGDCSGMDTYGLVYRSPDFSKGYWFQLTCGGDWSFGYWDGEEYVNLTDGSNSANAILTGSNQTNRVGVMATGSTHKLYVNGRLIVEVQDDTFTDAGSFGAVIAAFSTPNFTVSVDEFAYWKLE